MCAPVIYFQNSQWIVDSEALAARPVPHHEYAIPASQLLQTEDWMSDGVTTPCYKWLPHVASKTWADIEAFIAAFGWALLVHGYKPDLELLRTSCDLARGIAANVRRNRATSAGEAIGDDDEVGELEEEE